VVEAHLDQRSRPVRDQDREAGLTMCSLESLTTPEREILLQLVRMDIRKQERNRGKLRAKFGATADLGLPTGRLGVLRPVYEKLRESRHG
jgi:hypothetical protein